MNTDHLMPWEKGLRNSILAILDKPVMKEEDDPGDGTAFNPWEDIIRGICGGYTSSCDIIFIEVLKAVRDSRTFEIVAERGFAAELVLYILAGHGLLEYGMSPRGGWPTRSIADLYQRLIDKWQEYYTAVWGVPYTPHEEL